MAETQKTRWTNWPAPLAVMTLQEARLLSLVVGLLLLGLAVRFVHLRGDHSRVLPAAASQERSPRP